MEIQYFNSSPESYSCNVTKMFPVSKENKEMHSRSKVRNFYSNLVHIFSSWIYPYIFLPLRKKDADLTTWGSCGYTRKKQYSRKIVHGTFEKHSQALRKSSGEMWN